GIGISSGGAGFSGISVENSTIADNRAGGDGGGIGAFGENSSPFGGNSTTRLNGVTVARNLADSDSAGGGLGGGLYLGGGLDGLDAISVRNTIVALNAVGAGASGRDCFNASASFGSLGHNLIGDPTGCAGFDAAGDLFGGALKLGKLAGNGGPTKTIALKRGSRAINHAGSGVPKHDQRGVKRDKKPDIGAYERVATK
ncbi:MAG: choice-of-anchor Q domain-containing protein, partial [Solirubrobacterales bacterium]